MKERSQQSTNSGVYSIRDVTRNRFYIGSSKSLYKRLKRHFWELINNKHHNVYLQRIANKYGTHVLEVGIIEYCNENLLTREQFWIDRLDPELNIGSVGGEDNFSNHPDKERIREVHRKNLKRMIEEGKIGKPRHKEDNGNWRGGVSGTNPCPECGKDKRFYSKRCAGCSNKDRAGEKNSFYGKTHSQESINKRRKTMEGWKNIKCRKPLYAEGVIYESNTFAAKNLGLAQGTITFRCKSASDRWKDWYYLDDEDSR